MVRHGARPRWLCWDSVDGIRHRGLAYCSQVSGSIRYRTVPCLSLAAGQAPMSIPIFPNDAISSSRQARGRSDGFEGHRIPPQLAGRPSPYMSISEIENSVTSTPSATITTGGGSQQQDGVIISRFA